MRESLPSLPWIVRVIGSMACLVLPFLAGAADVQAGGGAVEPVVVAGDPSPVGSVFSRVFDLSVSNRGELAFKGFLADGRDGIFVVRAGVLAARVMDTDPGAEGGVAHSRSGPLLNGRGDLLYLENIRTGVATGTVAPQLVLDAGRGPRVVVRAGDALPDTPEIIGTFRSWVLGEREEVFYHANSALSQIGLFIDDGRSVEAVMLEGDAAPELPGGVRSLRFRGRSVVGVDGRGRPVYVTEVIVDGNVADRAVAVYRDRRPVAQVGDTVAGVPGTLHSARACDVSPRGEIAYVARFRGDEGESLGLFVDRGGDSRLILLAGEAPPGVGDPFEVVPARVSSFRCAINNRGDLAFVMVFGREEETQILFLHRKGRCVEIARSEDVLLDGDVKLRSFEDLAIDSSGRVAFLARLAPPEGPPTNGIFRTTGPPGRAAARVVFVPWSVRGEMGASRGVFGKSEKEGEGPRTGGRVHGLRR